MTQTIRKYDLPQRKRDEVTVIQGRQAGCGHKWCRVYIKTIRVYSDYWQTAVDPFDSWEGGPGFLFPLP